MENATSREHMLALIQQKHLERIQSALVSLKADGPSRDTEGICHNLDKEFERFGWFESESNMYAWLSSTFPLWPEYSGRNAFPVGDFSTANHQYVSASLHGIGGMWSDEPYGQARHRLLDFLIEQIEKDIEYVRSR